MCRLRYVKKIEYRSHRPLRAVASEYFLYAYHLRQQDLEIKVDRIFNTYGPRISPNDGRTVSDFVLQALRDAFLLLCERHDQCLRGLHRERARVVPGKRVSRLQ